MVVCRVLGEGGQLGRDVGSLDVRADERDVHLRQLTGDELEEQQRRVIRPVEVVEDEQRRLSGRHPLQRGGDLHEEPEPRRFVVPVGLGVELG